MVSCSQVHQLWVVRITRPRFWCPSTAVETATWRLWWVFCALYCCVCWCCCCCVCVCVTVRGLFLCVSMRADWTGFLFLDPPWKRRILKYVFIELGQKVVDWLIERKTKCETKRETEADMHEKIANIVSLFAKYITTTACAEYSSRQWTSEILHGLQWRIIPKPTNALLSCILIVGLPSKYPDLRNSGNVSHVEPLDLPNWATNRGHCRSFTERYYSRRDC